MVSASHSKSGSGTNDESTSKYFLCIEGRCLTAVFVEGDNFDTRRVLLKLLENVYTPVF